MFANVICINEEYSGLGIEINFHKVIKFAPLYNMWGFF